MYNIPKVAAIHDMSGIGRCSMTVIMPIMSALGCQVCPLPTALLSSHSEFKDFYFFDFTDHMEEYFNMWEKNNATFDCVYSGFIGSEKQIDIMEDIIGRIRKAGNPLIVVDPVMGDHGVIYQTYTKEMVEKMNTLVSVADIITPNLTEAEILLGEKYKCEKINIEKLKQYLKRLCDMGPRVSVITGIITEDDENINGCYDKINDKFYKVPFDYVNKRYPGTGDLFTSLFLGYLLQGKILPEAMEYASTFVSKAVLETYEAKTPGSEGVLFEKIMKELYVEKKSFSYTQI